MSGVELSKGVLAIACVVIVVFLCFFILMGISYYNRKPQAKKPNRKKKKDSVSSSIACRTPSSASCKPPTPSSSNTSVSVVSKSVKTKSGGGGGGGDSSSDRFTHARPDNWVQTLNEDEDDIRAPLYEIDPVVSHTAPTSPNVRLDLGRGSDSEESGNWSDNDENDADKLNRLEIDPATPVSIKRRLGTNDALSIRIPTRSPKKPSSSMSSSRAGSTASTPKVAARRTRSRSSSIGSVRSSSVNTARLADLEIETITPR